ncbi:hypothetical protein P4234_15190 [Pseudomonas aeruginosa]|nr:hypothetical protein [Pseudomonas aeruginosa]
MLRARMMSRQATSAVEWPIIHPEPTIVAFPPNASGTPARPALRPGHRPRSQPHGLPPATPAASSTAWSAAFWWSRTSMAARPFASAPDRLDPTGSPTLGALPRQPGGLERLHLAAEHRRDLPRHSRRARLLGFRGADRRTRHLLADRPAWSTEREKPAARAAGRTAPRRAPATCLPYPGIRACAGSPRHC